MTSFSAHSAIGMSKASQSAMRIRITSCIMAGCSGCA